MILNYKLRIIKIMPIPIRFTIHHNEEDIMFSPIHNIPEVIELILSSESINRFEITPSAINSIFNDTIITRPNVLNINSQKYGNIINKENYKECAICYDEFNNDSNISILDCTHCFHTDCIRKWGTRNNTCPVCRKEIPIIE